MLPWALCWTPICAIFSVCKAANLRVKRSQSSTVTLSDCVGCPAPWPQARQCANTSTSIDDRGTNVECLAVSYLSTREKGFEASTLNDEWQGHSGPVRKQTWEERYGKSSNITFERRWKYTWEQSIDESKVQQRQQQQQLLTKSKRRHCGRGKEVKRLT